MTHQHVHVFDSESGIAHTSAKDGTRITSLRCACGKAWGHYHGFTPQETVQAYWDARTPQEERIAEARLMEVGVERHIPDLISAYDRWKTAGGPMGQPASSRRVLPPTPPPDDGFTGEVVRAKNLQKWLKEKAGS